MLRGGGWGPWLSTMATNFDIALVIAVLIWCVGVGPFLLVHLPITLIAGSVGVWLFYVQHQFDPTFWVRDGEWTLHERPCMAVRITTCREFCAGSQRKSACTIFTTCAAAFRITACREHSATIPSSASVTLLRSFTCVAARALG